MKENVGRADQAWRSIAGPLLVYAGYSRLQGKKGRAAGLAAMIGGALIAESAVTRTCPLNEALGIDTRRKTRSVRLQKRVDRIRNQINGTGIPRAARQYLLQ